MFRDAGDDMHLPALDCGIPAGRPASHPSSPDFLEVCRESHRVAVVHRLHHRLARNLAESSEQVSNRREEYKATVCVALLVHCAQLCLLCGMFSSIISPVIDGIFSRQFQSILYEIANTGSVRSIVVDPLPRPFT
jgi:hypothetical protein